MIVATAQTVITADIHANARHICDALHEAAEQGARLVHCPEASLSGYAGAQIQDWGAFDWPGQRAALRLVCALAARLRIWVVLGTARQRRAPCLPRNCLVVIDDRGHIVGSYAKRLCSNTEQTYWYSSGKDPLVFEVDGIRFGCALCIEVVFPPVFADYEQRGVDCMLLSAYSQDPVHGVMARAHAATNCYWLSLATPVQSSATLPSQQFGPDGSLIGTAPSGVPALLRTQIDRSAAPFRVALDIARPWRRWKRVDTGAFHPPLGG